MAKKLVDVEDLLVWTASELSRKRPGNVVALPVLNVSRADRELTGRWSKPMGYPPMSPMFAAVLGQAGVARGDPPHADALIVEDALTRLAAISPPPLVDEADLTFGLGFALETAAPMRDAHANSANLALVHGRLGDRPDLRLEPPAPSARRAANGKPGVWRLEEWSEPTFGDHAQAIRTVEVACAPKRKDLYPTGAYGAVEWAPDPQALIDERAEYAGWLAGLAWLSEALAGKLETRAALSPRAARRPWMGERDGEPVRDLYRPGAEGVYGAHEARALKAERAAGRRKPVAGGAVYYDPAGARGSDAEEA